MNWFRRRRYNDLAVSMEEHIAEKTDELVESGMPRAEAEREARRAFGNRTVIAERSREAWQWPRLESFLADIKLVFRRMRNAPGFAITVLLTLAIGIGANTAVFTVVNSVLLKPLPYVNSGRLVALKLEAPGAGVASFQDGLPFSPSLYITFSEHNRTFEHVGVWSMDTADVTGAGVPEEVKTAGVSDGVLESLGVAPEVGRWLNAADQDPHGRLVAVLSYGYWQKRFGSNRNVIGQSIQVDGQTREIVGVMPRGFRIEDADFDLMEPLAFDRSKLALPPFGFNALGRLKPGVTLGQADADFSRLLEVWMDSWSNGPGSNSHYYERWRITANFRQMKQQVVGDVSNVLWLVMGTIGLVMLIACANVANLLMVRADARQQELAVRSALGAGRARIVRELLTESVVLGLIGGVLGIGVAEMALRLLVRMAPENMPRLNEIALDGWSVGFTLALSVLAGVAFGFIPAFKYGWSRAATSIGSGRTASLSRERHRSRDVLVIGQVALALVLLICATLMIRTFDQLRRVEPGFADAAHVETMRLSIPDTMISDPVMVMRTENAIVDKLSAIPGVKSAAFSELVPMDGLESDWDQVVVEFKTYANKTPPMRFFDDVSPGYFHTLGTRFVAGRDFDWTDLYGLRGKAIVSENFARESWGSAQAAVGKRIRVSGDWQEVIGVVEDVRQKGMAYAPPAIIYWPALKRNFWTPRAVDATRDVAFVVHSDRAGTEEMMERVQQAVWSVNRNLAIQGEETMGDISRHSMARTSFTLVMLAIAGGMALLLGVIGIYGVISYAVSQRTREIGIRMALGAQRNELRWMFVRSALVLTCAGVGIGLAAAAGMTQLMKSLLYGVSPIDPASFVAIPVVLTAAAALASYLPARRAASVDPMEALRTE
jgi:predicted permease